MLGYVIASVQEDWIEKAILRQSLHKALRAVNLNSSETHEPTCRSGDVLTLFRQQPYRQGIREQHYAQWYVKADYAADQLVEWVRNLAGTVY